MYGKLALSSGASVSCARTSRALRAAEVQHRRRRRVLDDLDAAVGGQMALDRRAVAHAQRAAGDEIEAVVGQSA